RARQPQIDLGLAAAGDAVEECRVIRLCRRACREDRERGLLLAGQVRHRRPRDAVRRAVAEGPALSTVEGIALDPASLDRDEPEFCQTGENVCRNALLGQRAQWEAVRGGAQQV